MIIKAKAISQEEIINDMGGTKIPYNDYIELNTYYNIVFICSSIDLKAKVSSGSIVMNDGSYDLSISNGLALITLQSQYSVDELRNQLSDIKPFFLLTYYSNSSNVKNMYMYTGSDASNKTGFPLSRNGKIISIAYMNYYPNTSGDNGYISIRKNDTYTEIAKLDIVEGSQKQYITSPSGSLEFSAGDWLSCYVSEGKLTKPVINVEITWI